MPVAVLAVLLLAQTAIAAVGGDKGIDGAWCGELSLGANSLTIVFHFSQKDTERPQCTMDSPDQGV